MRIVNYRPSNFFATALGFALMVIALGCSTITVARGGYARVLVTALACASLAAACLAVPLIRGPVGWRIAAAALALPLIFVVCDFLLRAPFVF